ncbi:hypothetical protein BBW65_00195 [Helicobacter enhydrae]|uniref:Glutamine amidotransferase domain-containing protein n=1 Tax=Helicobacter enhydrae TaxID=222136 RepID=A0A1B1U3K4_9HELI|nr:aminodeoxychorismate/anthranilate synthase component II [Helicobacter enhydrae]ANV97336.1 hypothetical protein BBW65_00195 [Helicobacter enhydrae]
MDKRVVLIDHHDSFTYNIVHYLQDLGARVEVLEAQEGVSEDPRLSEASHILLSPGPGHPKDALESLNIIQKFYKAKPILGVCLGHQCIALAFGGKVERGKEPIHGKTSRLSFVANPLFQGLEQGFGVMRYHSLCVSVLPSSLECIATSEGVIMALKHRDYPIYGVQFHPESILCENGKAIFENFLILSQT